MTAAAVPALEALRGAWEARWPEALACWSRFVKLSPPRWCLTPAEEKAERLAQSFAMIRLPDQAVVVSLPRVRAAGVEAFALEVLAHEVGHHVYCPATVLDQGRLLARVRKGLPTREKHAPMVANLYADLLINDRLQREHGLDLAAVYRAMGPSPGKLWQFYQRTYEILWRLDRGSLAGGPLVGGVEGDARLAARLVRHYARDWLDGAAGFAALCLPYLLEDDACAAQALGTWADTENSGH